MKGLGQLLRRMSTIFGLILIPLSIALFFYVHALSKRIEAKFAGPKWDILSKVYSDTLHIFPGLNIQSIQLREKLQHLGYKEVTDKTTRPGEYKLDSLSSANKIIWTIYLNNFDYPLKRFKGFPIRLHISDNVITQMLGQKKPSEPFTYLAVTELEPELLTEFFEDAREDRKIVKLEEVPANVLNGIVSVEDQRFLTHTGIDPKGILRALLSNLKAGSIVQGGSTITQQLVKNFFLTQKRSYIRKINEAIMAVILETRYSKDDILEAYVNEVYFGQRGSTGIHGVAEAARFYFGKDLNKLTLSESAMIAGIIRSPGIYSPFKNEKKAIQRRNFVLKKMVETKTILPQEYRAAAQAPLRPRNIPLTTNFAPYFVDHVRQELLQRYSPKILKTKGLRIFTTLDVALQSYARHAVRETVKRLDVPDAPEPLQGAFVALQPQTGYIRALVGGRDYSVSQFNRITQAHRQPGSLFKPFVLLAALTIRNGKKFQLTNRFSDTPFTWTYQRQSWKPRNYDEESRGNISLRTATEHSVNVVYARLARKIGIKRITKLAKKLGIQSTLKNVPSISLGSAEVTPLEMASAYSVLANNGTRATPISIKHVVNAKGELLEKQSIEMKRVVSPRAAYIVTHALRGVVDHGTGRGVRLAGYSRPAAGKTGTTNEYMDAWFAGYTTDLVGVSWVGYDKEKPVGLTGAQAALPIWARFMVKASEGSPIGDFFIPEGIVMKKIDPETGKLATPKCPESLEEAFIEGTEPKKGCPLHAVSVK